jgi:hypothetical protein
MSALVKIQKEADKEVFAVKLGETYVAVVNDDDNFYFLPDLYKSPLVACNAARSEKRKNSIVRNVKKKVNGVELKKPTKISRVAVRRRPSYGFDLAGSSFGVRPEAGVSRSTLAQLFPELDLGGTAATTSTAAEEVEKPDEETSTATPGAAGVTPIEDDTIPGSELDAYKISGSLSYAAPFNLQIGATGPQGRGSRLGYSGAVAKAEPSSTTGLSQSAASVAMPQLPQFDYSPMESLLELKVKVF